MILFLSFTKGNKKKKPCAMRPSMKLTSEQEQAARLFQRGGHVSVQAIPGAGKTALLIRTCLLAPKPCVILAYNVQLASDIKRAIAEADMQADVSCYTFHSLCTRTLAPARDDVGILQAVQAARSGAIQSKDVPEARVLIDESQDVRELYIQLLDVLGLCTPVFPTMVVGDRMQLIYDFDPDFPATEDALLRNPERAFYGNEQWAKIVLSQSRRLTRPWQHSHRQCLELTYIRPGMDDLWKYVLEMSSSCTNSFMT